jgi:hypothetical protein
MVKTSIYTKELGRLIAQSAKNRSLKKYHIIPWNNKWGVVPGNSFRATKTFPTVQQAVSFARKLAVSKQAQELVVHGNDGLVTKRISL